MSEDKTNEKDAENFYLYLIKRINSCTHASKRECKYRYKEAGEYRDKEAGKCKHEDKDTGKCRCEREEESTCGCQCHCQCKCKKLKCRLRRQYSAEENSFCDGKKIKIYLDRVVPDWEGMTTTRLYKHIQKMLENAEATRKFEIELIWKRVLYFIPVLVISFTAFGVGLFSFQKTIHNNYVSDFGFYNLSPEGAGLLTLLAIVNFMLSFLLANINAEGQKWQENWEYHVDYLQMILGLTLMRTCLRRKACLNSISNSNLLIGSIISLPWSGLFAISLDSYLKKGISTPDSYYFILIVMVLFPPFAFGFMGLWGYLNKLTKRSKTSYFRPLEGLQINRLND